MRIASRHVRTVQRSLAAGLALLAVMCGTTKAQVPTAYQDLYTALDNNVTTFNSSLGTPAPYPSIYTVTLGKAGANEGPGLLNPGYFDALQLQLQELQAAGVQGVMVEVGFPMLYAPFFTSITDYQNYVTFYSQVAYAVHSVGLKLIVENDVLLNPSNAGAAWNTSAFYATLTWDQYVQARADTAAVVAQTMQPDYLVLAEESLTEAGTTGQTSVNTPSGKAAMVSAMITSVQQSGVTGVQLGAGVGTWEPTFQTITQALVALPLNFIDMHIYETNFNFPANALTIASIASGAGLPVTMSEYWLHKVRDSEWGIIDQDTIRSRNGWSFWTPLDESFLQTMQNLANYTQMKFLNAFSTPNMFAYLDYNATSALTPDDLISLEQQTSGQANQTGTFSVTGQAFHNQVVSPADATAPSLPTGLTAHNVSASISWTASTDNIGVAGYNIYRNGSQIATTALLSYQDSGLTAGATYTYTISAFDEAGNTSAQTAAVSLKPPLTVPTAPTNLVLTALSSEKVKLAWTASTGPSIANYVVLWGTTPDPQSLTQVATPTTLSYTDFPLTPATTYFYAVQAVATTSGNVSPLSAVVSITTPDLPAAPGSITASPVSATQISVNWAASTGAFPISKYSIFRGTAPDGLTQIGTAGSAAVSYTDNSLTPGGTYYYAVQAIDNVGDYSPLSSIIPAATYALPTPPTGITATPNSATQILATWTAPTTSGLPIARYYIFQGTSPSSLSQVGIRTGTQYTDTSVSPSSTYYYAVESVDTAGDVSPMSAPVSATTYDLPLTPTGATATTASDAKINFTWTSAATPPNGLPISTYYVYQGTSAGNMTKVAQRAGNLFIDVTVSPATTYYYGVATVDSAGDVSPVSAAVSTTTYTQPTVPTLTATPGSTKVTLSWTASTGSVPISNYSIFRGTTASSLAQIATAAGTTYTDSSLAAVTTYYYAVQATDSAGDLSPLSTVVPVTTLPLPGSNTVTATTLSDSKVALAWAAPSGVTVTSYSVFRGTSPSSLSQIASVTTKSYRDTGLTASTTYYYAEQAVTSSGPLPISPTVSATTYQVPATPVLSLSVASFAEIDLSWTVSTASVPIDHYSIYRGLTSTTLALLTTSATNSYADTSLTPSTTYYYQVQAVDTAGDISARSTKVSAATQAPPPPVNLTATPDSSSRIVLGWAPPASGPAVASYNIFRGASVATLAKIASTTNTAYTDAGLTPAAQYYYAVQAVDTAGAASGLSSAAVASTYPLPTAPTGLTATPTTNQIALTWNASNGTLAIASYNIFRGTSATSLSQIASSVTNSYTDSGLAAGATYYYAVQGVDTAGDFSPQSAVLQTMTLAIVSAPTYVAASATSNHSVLISWQPAQSVNPIAHYSIYRGTSANSLTLIATIGTQLSYTDNGASPNTTYYYAVKAADSAGNQSPLSATTTVTVPQSNGHGNGGGHGHGH